jgi:hypothetical protein
LNRGHIQFKSALQRWKRISINPVSPECCVFLLSFWSLGKQMLSQEWFLKVSLRLPTYISFKTKQLMLLVMPTFETSVFVSILCSCFCFWLGIEKYTIFTVCTQTQGLLYFGLLSSWVQKKTVHDIHAPSCSLVFKRILF